MNNQLDGNCTCLCFLLIDSGKTLIKGKKIKNHTHKDSENRDFNKAMKKSAQSRISRPVSYTHLTLPTNTVTCRSRWSPYH